MNAGPRLLGAELPDTGRRQWSSLYGGAKALAIAEAARQAAGPLLVVVNGSREAEDLQADLEFFLDDAVAPSVSVFPDWEVLPYDQFSPYQDIISDRLRLMARLPEWRSGVLLVPVRTVMVRLPPPAFVAGQAFDLEAGARCDRNGLFQRLGDAGYRRADQVLEHGEYAVRGSIVDLFPMGSDRPYRLELFDDEVESIRAFNPEDQRSGEKIEQVSLLPAREFPMTEVGIRDFKRRWRRSFEGRPQACPVFNEVSEGILTGGIEFYLPLFHDQLGTLFDFLPADTAVVLDDGVDELAREFADEIASRYESRRYDTTRPLCAPASLFLDHDELLQRTASRPCVQLLGTGAAPSPTDTVDFACQAAVKVALDGRAEEPLAAFNAYRDSIGDDPLILVAESEGRRETLVELFRRRKQHLLVTETWSTAVQGDTSLRLVTGPLHAGFRIPGVLAVLTESELFGRRPRHRLRRSRGAQDVEALIRDLNELEPGAAVVHERHGVGRYEGLVTLEVDGVPAEFIHLRYADDDKLYVPVSALSLVSRYTGFDPERAPLHKLGAGHWQKARDKAAKQVRDVAAELLELQARRQARTGLALHVEDDPYSRFAAGFPFEETADQEQAIHQVLSDLASDKPMDRLVCGDVGFGKTEVAMRAAFVAANAGYQVAVLVPTTLLAQQHHKNFCDRFADWPIRIEQLSRFRSKKEVDAALSGLTEGTIDIVIGTHRLLQEDIRFKRLGLLVVDEEHRFGVRHKERIKALRAECDILALTATPIPRSLNFALSGIRDLSLIATAPSRRLPVQTFVRPRDEAMIKEAIQREISRGGQVYFLHNKVEDIAVVATELKRLVPEARVEFAHGQMADAQLEGIMLDFFHRRFNVLVCTTIIESGLDNPTANTMIIDRADKLGLAQLYQLRGRVGRSHHRAYAYLLVPDRKSMTPDAVKRMEAIESLQELGIGFTLATHDLEIRGAGEILGEKQSGHIESIGFALYSDYLERAVAALKAGREPELERPLEDGLEVRLHAPSLIPEDYVPDVNLRLTLYKRVATARDVAELGELTEEFADRFGPLPPATRTLVESAEIKLLLEPMGITLVDLGPGGGRIELVAEPNLDVAKLIQLVQTQRHNYRFEGGERIMVRKELPDVRDRLDEIRAFADFVMISAAA